MKPIQEPCKKDCCSCPKRCLASKVIKGLFQGFGVLSASTLVALAFIKFTDKPLAVEIQIGSLVIFGVTLILWGLQLPCMRPHKG